MRYKGPSAAVALAVLTAPLLVLPGHAQQGGTSYYGPSGEKVSTVRCTRTSTGCFQKASAACGGPYQVLDSYSNAGGILADFIPGPVTWYTMSFQCGPSDGRMPH